MGRVARLYRHPIKALGVEPLGAVTLQPAQGMPGDRVWAVAHEAARLTDGWAPCTNFIRGAAHACLMAITLRSDADAGTVTLSHPDRKDLTLDLDADPSALIDWVTPLCGGERAAPRRVHRADRALTDTDFVSISILGTDTLAALSEKAGRPLDQRRFRGNIWIDDLPPFAEFDWIGREIGIGGARLRVREPITRCSATGVDPETGQADIDLLAVLEQGWGHQEFGVYAEVTSGGSVALGDGVWT